MSPEPCRATPQGGPRDAEPKVPPQPACQSLRLGLHARAPSWFLKKHLSVQFVSVLTTARFFRKLIWWETVPSTLEDGGSVGVRPHSGQAAQMPPGGGGHRPGHRLSRGPGAAVGPPHSMFLMLQCSLGFLYLSIFLSDILPRLLSF